MSLFDAIYPRHNPSHVSYAQMEPPADVLYRVSKRQRQQAIDEKATIIVDLDPYTFVSMATCHPETEAQIRRTASPLAKYHSEEWESIVHPMLAVQQSGQITSHEGRHRAVAVAKAGGQWYRVAIMLRPSSRKQSILDVPMRLENGLCRFDLLRLESQGKMRIVHPNVQWEYQQR